MTLSNARWTVELDGGGGAKTSVKIKVANLIIAEERVPPDTKFHLDLLEAQKGIVIRPELVVNMRTFTFGS